MDDLMPELMAIYPTVDEKVLREIVREGYKRLNLAIAQGNEVNIEINTLNVKHLMFYPSLDPKNRKLPRNGRNPTYVKKHVQRRAATES